MSTHIHHSVDDDQVERTLKHLAAVLHGDKPTLILADPLTLHGDEKRRAFNDRRLLEQFKRMYQGNYIVDPPALFFTIRPQDSETARAMLGEWVSAGGAKPAVANTRYQILARELSQYPQDLSHKGENYDVLGTSLKRRQKIANGEPLTIEDFARDRVLVGPKEGDPQALYEFLWLVHYRLHHQNDRPPLFLVNTTDFWKHILGESGIAEALPQGRAFQPIHQLAPGVMLVANEREMENHLRTVRFPTKSNRMRQSSLNGLNLPPTQHGLQPAIFVATKTDEKIVELQHAFADTGVKIVRLDSIANFRNPAEKGGTYTANSVEKLEAGCDALQKTIEKHGHEVADVLVANGIDPHRVYVAAEDSGMHLRDPRVARGLRAKLKSLGVPADIVTHDHCTPGVEFGPYTNGALGPEHFFTAVNEVIQEIDAQEEHKAGQEDKTRGPHSRSKQGYDAEDHSPRDFAIAREEKANRGFINTSVMALRHMDLHAPRRRTAPLVFGGTLELTLEHEPRPKRTIATISDYLMVPPNVTPIMKWGGMPKSVKADDPMRYLDPNNQSPTQTELMEAHQRAGQSYAEHYGPRFQSAHAVREALGIPRQDKRARKEEKLNLAAISDAQDAMTTRSWDSDVEELLAGRDGVLLKGGGKPDEAHVLRRGFLFFSLIAAKQLSPRDKDKPFLVQHGAGGESGWKDMLGLYDDLRRYAMINDQSRILVREVTNDAQAQEECSIAAHNRLRGTEALHKAEHLESTGDSARREGKRNIAVFCSATAKNSAFNDATEQLSFNLAQEGNGIVFGAGDREMMGSVLKGAKRANGYIAGCSTPDIINVEADDAPGLRKALDVYHETPDIYARMRWMIKESDGFAVMPGGAGTLQELFLLLMLKQSRDALVKDKPVVLYNAPIDPSRENGPRFYDSLIATVGKERLAGLAVSIANTIEETQSKLNGLGRDLKRGDEPQNGRHY